MGPILVVSLMSVSPSDDNEVEDAGARLPDVPKVWTDGNLVREEVSGVCSGGAGENALVSGWRHWG